MPRVARKYIQTLFIHVITQGINKSYIFKETQDKKIYIKSMYELKKAYNIKIVAYCVMDNHTHMLLKSEKLNDLSKYMQCLNTKYAVYYNKKYNRIGFVFRDRFKSEEIYSKKHFFNCISYIYNNPVKAGLCNKACEYQFSNFKEIPQQYIDEDYLFMDVDINKQQEGKSLIQKFLIKNNIELEDLNHDEIKLKQMVINLKEKGKISLRDIAKASKINRERIRKIYIEECQRSPSQMTYRPK